MTNELSLHLTAGPVSGQNLSGWHSLNDILARNLIECKNDGFVNCKKKVVPLKQIEIAEALIRAYQFCRAAGLTQSFASRVSDFE